MGCAVTPSPAEGREDGRLLLSFELEGEEGVRRHRRDHQPDHAGRALPRFGAAQLVMPSLRSRSQASSPHW